MGCELADTFALVVQGLLGVLALASLVWKRYIESPPRTLTIWLFDTSKQVTGGGTAHVTNVLLGVFMDSLGAGAVVAGVGAGAGGAGALQGIDAGGSDQCVWYLVFLTLECTLGVGLLCALLHILNYAAQRFFCLKHFVSGEYGSPPRPKLWLKQLLAYQGLLLLMKASLALLVLGLHDSLRAAGRALLRPLEPYPRLQLLLVMVVVPLALTVFSFWVQVRARSPSPLLVLLFGFYLFGLSRAAEPPAPPRARARRRTT